MIPLYTRDEMRAVDRAASERHKIPSVLLMENAGARAAEHLFRRYPDKLARVLILGGEGQNGGDGWVVARQLAAQGLSPRCVLVGRAERVRGDARVNLEAVLALGVALEILDESALSDAAALDAALERLARELAQASLVVDALFGTGLARAIEGVQARAIAALNQVAAPVCALDLPSGIDADNGQLLGIAVRASSTVTFAGHKRGLHQYPGVQHAGSVECVGIGAPAPSDGRVGLIEPSDVARLLTPAAGDAHKGTRGHVLAIAGSAGKTGAAILAAWGALRSGAGLVTIAADEQTRRALEQKVVEVMTARIASGAPLASVIALAEGKAAALLGPGFGLAPERLAFAREIARELPLPCVLDADALTAFAGAPELLRRTSAARVLTPHPGEAARLLARTTAAVQSDRFAAARELAERAGQVVVLKGARTVIAAPDGRLRVCTAGTPALGTAGTGDVLAGVLAALSARAEPFDAAWAAVHLHATAGELAAQSDRGMLAGEVASALPRALEHLRAAKRVAPDPVPLIPGA